MLAEVVGGLAIISILVTLACILSGVAALGYGFFYLDKAPSAVRALFKTLFMAALVIVVLLWPGSIEIAHLRPLLLAAVTASAFGDFALAFDKKWMLLGILSFLIAQLCYLLVFGNLANAEDPVLLRYGAIALLVIVAVAFLVMLWPKLGSLAFGVVPYSAAITGMASTAMLLPWAGWPAMLGATLFFVSDTTLSFELFRLPPDAPMRRITGPIVWWTYVGAQTFILIGVLKAATHVNF